MSEALYQWQQTAWQSFAGLRERLPHAFLLYGPRGIGKFQFAQQMAKSLLCEAPQPDGQACGSCASCGWFAQYSHPDYRRVRPETLDEDDSPADSEADPAGKTAKAGKAPSKEIVIQQVRALADFMNVSAHRQGRKVVLIYPAEALNVPAANALLKSLEEPSGATVFILVSHHLDKLLPTILSRCHKFPLPMPAQQQALQWLQQQGVSDAADWLALQGGAPLAALEQAQAENRAELQEMLRLLAKPAPDAMLKLAEKLQKSDLPLLVSWLQRWLYDVFSCRQSGIIRYYPRYQAEIRQLAETVNLAAVLKLIKACEERQAVATHPLSPKLFLEDMLLDYAAVFG